ncbi:MAG: hypothetical protein MJ078_03055, partial [Clostridia bacterium]|nr:hypothetical protein [Clostridia bacterium]
MPNSFDTYERDQKKSYDKETFEWITSWCDYANNHDLPRILLIGDSIVRGYYNHVKEALKDKVRVDYISTSYSITNPIYRKVVVEMAKNSKYQRIYFNFGLHAGGLSARSYKAGYKKVLKELLALAPVTVMASTTVYQNGKDKLDTA